LLLVILLLCCRCCVATVLYWYCILLVICMSVYWCLRLKPSPLVGISNLSKSIEINRYSTNSCLAVGANHSCMQNMPWWIERAVVHVGDLCVTARTVDDIVIARIITKSPLTETRPIAHSANITSPD
jgi:hypothetical protein